MAWKNQLYEGSYSDLIDQEGYAAINSAVEEGLDELHNGAIKEFDESIKVSYTQVVQAANELILLADNILYKEKASETAIRARIKNTQSLQNAILAETKNDINRKMLRKQILDKVLELQNLMAGFLGFKFVIGYLTIGKNSIKVYESENNIEHWDPDGRTRLSLMKKTATLVQEHNKNEDNLNDIFDKLNDTFDEVHARELISKSQIKSNSFFIFWKVKNKWAGYKVSNEGVIGEAYFNFYIHRDNNFNNTKEHNVGRYMIIGVGDVDNMSGLLSGDTSVGKYQYVVKANKAEFMRYGEIISNYATRIVEEVHSEQDLKNILNNIYTEMNNNKGKLAASITPKMIDELPDIKGILKITNKRIEKQI